MFSTRIDAVAFDMDGLVLNTEDLYGEVGQIMMKQRGRTYRDEVRRAMIGLPAPQAFGVLIEAESLTETWQELQEEIGVVLVEAAETFGDNLDRRRLGVGGLRGGDWWCDFLRGRWRLGVSVK